MLEIQDLTVQYGDEPPAVEHCSLTVGRGEIVAVVGESGSGKNQRDPRGAGRAARRRPGHGGRHPL